MSWQMVFTVYAFNGLSLFFLVRRSSLNFLYDIALVDIIWVMRNAVRASDSSLLDNKIRPLVTTLLCAKDCV